MLDAPWASDPNALPDLLPTAVAGSHTGLSGEHRVAVMRQATGVELRALGVSDADISAIRTGLEQGNHQATRAIDTAFGRLDPDSDVARAARAEVSAKAAGDYDGSGSSGNSTVTRLPDGSFRVDDANGNEIGTVKDAEGAKRLADAHDAEMETRANEAGTNEAAADESSMAPEAKQDAEGDAANDEGVNAEGAVPNDPTKAQSSHQIASDAVVETFINSIDDPNARVPESEKAHKNIDILGNITDDSHQSLDLSSEPVRPFREDFDQRHHSVDGYFIGKDFIPATSEAAARSEHARRQGNSRRKREVTAQPGTAWVDQDGNTTSFRTPEEHARWRDDQIRTDYINTHLRENGNGIPVDTSFDEAAKQYPFLDIMATIPHTRASYNIESGDFNMEVSQGGRNYALQGNIWGNTIEIAGLFPIDDATSSAGINSFGSDFMTIVLAYSRQMPGMTIKTNAARNDAHGSDGSIHMNGYAMWPKLGFEAQNSIDLQRIINRSRTPKEASQRMRELANDQDGLPSLTKLVSTAEGKALWKKYGDSIDVHFKASPDNADMKDFATTVRRIYKRNQRQKAKNISDQNSNLQSE